MIKVSRLRGSEFVINADLIKMLEQTPDTIITLTSNERLVVRESVDEVVRRIIQYRRQVRLIPEME